MSHALSKFLPESFNPQDGIGLIAGKALYPQMVAQRMQAAGVKVKLIAYEGETLESLYNSFPEEDRIRIKVGKLGKLLKSLKKFGVKHALMAGQITPGRLFKDLFPDLKAVAMLAGLKEKNAETIFGAISADIEKLGIQMLDARVFLDDQLADIGEMTPRKEKITPKYVEHGIEIAKEIARLDVGQGVVIRKGTIVAVEAFEGTDRMLERAGTFGTTHMVFIKTVKPVQDYRFDVPVFGMKTLETMKAAGINNVWLESGNTIMLEKDSVLKQAKAWGIHISGYQT